MEGNALTTIEVVDTENGFTVTKIQNVSWKNKKVQGELAQIGVVYHGGCHAVKIMHRKMNNPLLALGTEDDDRIFFEKYQGQYSHSFDMGWSGDLISVVRDAYNAAMKTTS